MRSTLLLPFLSLLASAAAVPTPGEDATLNHPAARGIDWSKSPLVPSWYQGDPTNSTSAFGSAKRDVRPRASPLPSIPGYIQVVDITGTTVLAYMSQTPFLGLYAIQKDLTNVADRLIVTLSGSGSGVSITTVNGPNTAKYPYFGATVGPDSISNDIGPGSFNYLLLGGENFLPPGAGPTQGFDSYHDFFSDAQTGELAATFETSIWNVGPGGLLTPQWINTDLRQPGPATLPFIYNYVPDNPAIVVMTGDIAAFNAKFTGKQPPPQPDVPPVTQVVLFFVPI